MALPRRRSHEEPDDDCPTEMMRTRVMQREELASAVVPTAKPLRARPPSVKLRRTLAAARPPSDALRAARAAATTEETVAHGKTPASTRSPRADDEEPASASHAPSIAPVSIDVAAARVEAPAVDPQPSVELDIPTAEHTAPLPPTLPAISSRRHAPAPASLPPWGDESFVKPRAQAVASHTEAIRPTPWMPELASRPAPPVQVSYRPLKLDLETRSNDPNATQPSRRRRIEEASRRNWAAIAIAGGFVAGLLGSAVPLVSSMTAAPQVARVSRVHVSTPTPLAVTTGAQSRGADAPEAIPQAVAAPHKKSAAPGASRTSAKVTHGEANATPALAPPQGAAAGEPPAPAEPPAPPAPAEPPKTEAKPADLNGRDLLSDGL
ncbi:MAG: hypothetical protein KC657_38655 [Myxococcales bacterium]|nr:hypothetical protein [Myxococcales bacterium]